MAEVWEASDEMLGRTVALKVILTSIAGNEAFAPRFLREARLAGALAHPHILPIYDFGTEGDAVFLVTQLVTGGSLEQKLRSPVAPASAFEWLTSIASALDLAHSRQVVHRDVKPANILFDDGGRPYLADFGIAKDLGADSQLTVTGTVMGTPAYMAPEQATGQGAFPATDQYALAVLAFRLLVGRTPLEGTPTPVLLFKTINSPMPAATSFAKQLPAAVDRVFARAFAKQPEERFPSCAAFVQELHRAFESGPRAAAGAPAPPQGPAAPPGPVPSPRRKAPPGLPSRSSLGPVVGLVGLGAVAAAVAGFFLLRPAKAPAPREAEPTAAAPATAAPSPATVATATASPEPAATAATGPSPTAPLAVKVPPTPAPTAASRPTPRSTRTPRPAAPQATAAVAPTQAPAAEATPVPVTPAERIDSPAPAYPGQARAAGIQGTVVLDVTVGIDGSVRSARVLKGVEASLDEAALRAVRQWRYRPARRGGVPVESTFNVSVAFRIPGRGGG